jgi:hypothetical protein
MAVSLKGRLKFIINSDKVEDVFSENLEKGYRIVRDNGELSLTIEWVDLVQQSDNEIDTLVEVHFEDGTDEVFEKGVKLRKIWHENVTVICSEDAMFFRVYCVVIVVLFVGMSVYLGDSIILSTDGAFLLCVLPILAIPIAFPVFVVIDLLRD